MAQSQGFRAQMGRLCLVFTYILQEDVSKIPLEPGVLRNVNATRAMTWLIKAQPFVEPFFNNNSPPPLQFLRDKKFS